MTEEKINGPSYSGCGVGFVTSLDGQASQRNLKLGLKALENLEHRGGLSSDGETSDGSGVMTDIPHRLLGVQPGDAVAQLFLPREPTTRLRALKIFEKTFSHLGLDIVQLREVPIDKHVLSPALDQYRPEFLMAFIRRPEECHSRLSFEKRLYGAKQLTRGRLREAGIIKQFFFTSLSAQTIVYKALTPSHRLAKLFLDLSHSDYHTRFVLFHRRYSTNTATAWDTAQPFRVVAHNGEINTISGNLAWAVSRERALGLSEDELVTRRGISDSGSLNEMIEALFFRSSIPHPEDILAILMPQADARAAYYKFWSRAMEPWDGPALFVFSDGRTVGARLDRSGFRPCRWAQTKDHFFLSSEAGSFQVPEDEILAKGSLSGGASVSVNLTSGLVRFEDASRSRENLNASFDPRLRRLERLAPSESQAPSSAKLNLFGFTEEDITKIIAPLIREGKEGIGSMGDTARLAVLSDEPRSLFDFFFQRFAQVTNPPLDYLREKIVTNMSIVLGRKPNIFEPKELVPLKVGIELDGPVLSLGQMEFLKQLDRNSGFEGDWPAPFILDTVYDRSLGSQGLLEKIEQLKNQATEAIHRRNSILILSDRKASEAHPAIPVIFVITSLNQHLDRLGLRLRVSLVVESGEIKAPHSLAVVTAFGAAAVCPYLLLELAREYPASFFGEARLENPQTRELRLISALEAGLLKVMSKAGISTFSSYHSAKLFTIVGLSPQIHRLFFPNHESWVGGLNLEQLLLPKDAPTEGGTTGLPHRYLYREHPKQRVGERHSMTISQSKMVHRLVTQKGTYDDYLNAHAASEPISLRHLLRPKQTERALKPDEVEPTTHILSRFGSGAMSFGAISAETQKDIILAMRELGGRSNSGEGGENPYYASEGITAHTKQIASGRFGVTAEYLVHSQEIQIKIAQGAKPGEGGQLMAAKVTADIAKARHCEPNVDLISPPPMHDIYSIEDLKELIYELRQLKPTSVSVKLVSGENIGTIAVGVAKAGADIIHISGHDGGTGAASLSSMKHAGLPWEMGLQEAHRALVQSGFRRFVKLRVDGGLATGRDIVTAAILGAEEFDFGKLLLVAQGCIMARVCEKNSCPTGIATHDPQFKRLYRGDKDRIVRLLTAIARDVQEHLCRAGVPTLPGLVGRYDLLEIDPSHASLVQDRGLDLRRFLEEPRPEFKKEPSPFIEPISALNREIVETATSSTVDRCLIFPISTKDRAIPATLSGVLAQQKKTPSIRLEFHGSAGQGFGAFLQKGIELVLYGEANDSVGKSMSGGRIIVRLSPKSQLDAATHSLLGNCTLYGATGGMLFANGVAGDRFAVRNSGALAVVESAGLHCSEYMTGGTVVVLGDCGKNIGAGMTGGTLFLRQRALAHLNQEYLISTETSRADRQAIRLLLEEYFRYTGSTTAASLLLDWEAESQTFFKCVPVLRLSETIKVSPPVKTSSVLPLHS